MTDPFSESRVSDLINGDILVIQTKSLSMKLKTVTNELLEGYAKQFIPSVKNISVENLHTKLSVAQCHEIIHNIRSSSLDLTIVPYEISRFLSDTLNPERYMIPFEEHLRILPPSSKDEGDKMLVSLHRDTWLGFPAKGFNFWVPVSNTPSASLKFFPEVYDKKVKTVRYNKSDVRPHPDLNDNYGSFTPNVSFQETLLFSSHHLHGSAQNLTNLARVSWDYRIVDSRMLNPGTRINEFVFMDILIQNRSDPDTVLALTKERLKSISSKTVYVSYLYSMKVKSNPILGLIAKCIRRLKLLFLRYSYH